MEASVSKGERITRDRAPANSQLLVHDLTALSFSLLFSRLLGTDDYHLLFGLGPDEDLGDLGEVSELKGRIKTC